jgi:phenylalanyl-tRNA synthetase beta chain
MSAAAAAQALAQIEIAAEPADDRVEVEAPSFRPDLEREEDLIEEIVRIQGYDRLPSTVPALRGVGGEQESYRTRRRVREMLVRAGLREAASLTFASAADVELMRHTDPVRVANPPSAEEPFLRTSLLPRLLDAASRNQQRGEISIPLFEIGHVFRLADPVDEREHFAIILAGRAGEGLHAQDRGWDALDAKGILDAVLGGLGVEWTIEPGADRPFHPGRAGSVLVGERRMGVVGELHPAEAERLDLAGRVAVAELDVTALEVEGARAVAFSDVPRFPPLRRDLAFIVPDEATAGDVQRILEAAAGSLLDRVVLFDLFTGGDVLAGHRSLAFALEFRAPDRTLTDEEVEPLVAAIVDRARSELGAELRA